MSQSISLLGATYSNVPAVELPKTGGGTASFTDVTDTTAAASDVAQGKYFYTAAGVKTQGTSSGGGGGVTVESLSVTQNGTYTAPTGKAYTPVTVNVSGGSGVESGVRFYDYDGTLLHSYTAQEAAQLSALPANPTHTGLTAQGWNWSLADIKSYLTNHPDGIVNVGQTYITTSDDTEIYVSLPADALHPYMGLGVNGTVVIDWGDGSATDTLTGTTMSTVQWADHVYSAAGKYVIRLSVTGSIEFQNASTTSIGLLSDTNKTTRSTKYAVWISKVLSGSGYGSNYSYRICRVYGLNYFTIPNGVTSIGEQAFNSCCFLTSLTIPDTVTSIGGSAFASCYSLTSLTIPNGVTSIGNSAFNGCYSLTSLTIPDTVTSIGGSAFASCYSLTSLTIPNGVTSIGNGLFSGCYSLTSLTIPNGVTSIGSSVFASCYSLASVTIPSTVTSIGSSAFASCYSITSLTIPSSVTSIGDSAFSNCRSLTSLTIPSGCTVGRNAFQGCALFTSLPVPLPSDATDIKANEFNGCYSLTSLTIPDTVTSIGNYAFSSCYSLTSLAIPDGVTSIGTNAFASCYSLTSLTIPDIVTSIGNSAFGGCYSMKEYHFLPTTPPTLGGSSVFSNIPSDCVIYVPYSADHSILTAYQTASNWSSQASKMQEEPQT